MSIFHTRTAICGKCGNKVGVDRTASVNADRRPDLRAALIAGTFQAVKCGKCGTEMRLPPHLTYLDLGHGQWIAAEPAALIDQWPEAEAEAQKAYDVAFGEEATPAAREIGEELKPRLVFGWPALREKLIADDLGLDDITLELLKMAIMRDVDEPPLADQSELRLFGGDETVLRFAWIDTRNEQHLVELDIPREIYDDVAGDAEIWATARAQFEGKLLVDLRRLLAGPEAV
jgi:hypothetical protein